MNDEHPSIEPTLAPETEKRFEEICQQFEAAWQAGKAPSLTKFLVDPSVPAFDVLLRRLLAIDVEHQSTDSWPEAKARYLSQFPEHVDIVDSVIAAASTKRGTEKTLQFEASAQEAVASIDTAGSLASTEDGKRRPKSNDDLLGKVPKIPGYEVTEVIGRGGMGLVVKARDVVLKREVAIKLPLRSQVAGDSDHERFLREARAAAGLRHPHICPIYDVGAVGGRPYLVMGFIAGQSLAEWSKQREASPREVAEVIAALARAVSYAHQRDLVHRDIKPANVMIDAETNKPVLMDFGLAKNLAEEDVQLTQSGQVMGTPVYMAPEQAAGRIEEIGPLSDIYALGVALYELLCKQRPFQGSFGEVLKQVQTAEPTPPRKLKPGLHRDLETICMKAMSKEPDRRYTSAADLAEDLERFCAGEAIQARREPVIAAVARRVRRNPVVVLSSVAVVIAIVAVAIFASSYASVQRTTSVVRAIDEHLQQPEVTPEFLVQADELVAQLREFDPDEADAAIQRINQAFDAGIREALRQPSLSESDNQNIREAINQLADRDPKRAKPLRSLLAQRERNWQQVFRLDEQHQNATMVFPADSIRDEDGRLLASFSQNSNHKATNVLTQHGDSGNVELHATFDSSWTSATEIGLLFDAGGLSGYRFVLQTVDIRPNSSNSSHTQRITFEEARQDLRVVRLLIYRGQTLLTEQQRGATSLPSESLTLYARREGNWLTFQAGDIEPLRFRDIFSSSSRHSGVFGLVWPRGVGLTNLRANRKRVATATSPLELGDELFLQEQFSEALDRYRQQAIESAGTTTASEAQYKEALCLLELSRDEEAAQQLEAVVATGQSGNVADDDSDWHMLAACRLWLLRLQQRRGEEADAVYQSLATRYRFDELAGMVPEVLRREIIQHYHSGGTGINLLAFNPDRIRNLERAIQVERFLRVPEISHVHTKRSLVRAYRLAGDIRKAIRFSEDLVQAETIDRITGGDNIVEEYSWLMRVHGDPRQALREIDRRLFEAPGVLREPLANLLVERARIHANLDQWEQAERDIDDYFKLSEGVKPSTHYFAAASLIRGFLRERRGDQVGATDAWRVGREVVRQSMEDSYRSFTGEGSRMAQLTYIMLAGLSDTLSDEEADALIRDAFKAQATGTVGALFQSAVKIPPSLLREMWQTKRGHDAARRMAFQTTTFSDYVQLPVLVAGSYYIQQNAFGGSTTPEDETVVWNLAKSMMAAHKGGSVSAANLLQLGLTWKGTTNTFGWGGVKDALTPQLRAPMAYVLGHRFRRLGKNDKSLTFFQLADDDAAEDSLVKRLAQTHLSGNGS